MCDSHGDSSGGAGIVVVVVVVNCIGSYGGSGRCCRQVVEMALSGVHCETLSPFSKRALWFCFCV